MRSRFARGAAAGAAAGLVAATLAFFWLEPVLREAIALEGGGTIADDGIVSRSVQERVGAPLGFVLVGLAFGLVLAAVDRAARPSADPWRRALVLTGGVALAAFVVPQLRYPANPPGVGDPETVTSRTGAYLVAVVLGALIAVLVAIAWRTLADDTGRVPPGSQVGVVAGALLLVALTWLALPSSGDPVEVPAALLWDFRIRSLGVTALLWVVLGATYGALTLRTAARERQPVAA
jgi:hypothetical protein